MSLTLLSYFLGIITIPLYFFDSGGVQISDLFFAISIVSTTFSGVSKSKINFVYRETYFLFFFTAWVVLVNTVCYLWNGDFFSLKSAAFMCYNLFTFIYTLYLLEIHGNKFVKLIYYSFIVSILSVFLVLFFELDHMFNSQVLFRRSGTFNNPNQLGYYGLLSMIIIAQLNQFLISRNITSLDISLPFILMSVFFIALSLSKAAMLSGLVVLFQVFRKRKFLIVILILLCAATNTGQKVLEFEETTRVVNRLNDVGSANDDSLEGRNYDRIWHYPQYVFLGAGEVAYTRFGRDNEIHSSVATILFSYGIIGLLILGYWIYSSRIVSLWSLFPLIAIGMYSVTHIGHRFKLFWIILPLFSYINYKRILNGYSDGRLESTT